ncbi:carboxypeptidase regulatory-like domain-containing protein [Robertkochia sediminum]|uniref:carboxypeptidase regulatory-like domain-containing protein n=1 Tax=Robertkochia sediminum TaxID=2785326 RepID=UPI001931B048|nr:carboxypeptidase regulatory-like domain-containing protein [Robertkochia sediminum]MBL7471281.1 carboxypeptidase regulatory-like domain-containing protein [Robertkochia sediminum]
MKTLLKNICLFTLVFSGITACSEDTIDVSGEGTLTGKVVTAVGNEPLENVKISTTPVSTTIFTDAEGNFMIDNLEVGEYSVQAELDDFVTAFEPANIIDGQTVNVVFEMDSVSSKNIAPKTPVLVSPADGEEGVPTEVTLVWNASDNDKDEVLYDLQLRNGKTNAVEVFEALTDTTYTVTDLEMGVNYFWQVTANDGINEEVSSAIAGFSTVTPDFRNFRVYFTREVDGNNVIYGAADTETDVSSEEAYAVTATDKNSFRPRRDPNSGKVAFLRTVGAETHLFTMNSDGSDVMQVTRDIPVAGFNLEEIDFAWFNNGAQLYYPNFDKLYAINANGTGVELAYTVPTGKFITKVAVNAVNEQVAIQVNDSDGYGAEILVIDPNTDTTLEVVESGKQGALGGLDFSIGGTRVLYTRDISGSENAQYRQLDTYIFEYNMQTNVTTRLNVDKASGTLDLNPRYSPDDGSIIFVNTSNDGISQRNIYKVTFDAELNRELIFENAFMPDWE